MIHPDTELRFVHTDIANRRFMFSLIPSVPQPLWPFLEERDAVAQALARRAPASITRDFVDVAAPPGAHPSLARRT